MRVVFVDTSYLVARINPRDQWHRKAAELISSLKGTSLITTDAVLIELLNYFSGYGPEMREAVASIVRHIMDDEGIEIVGTAGWFERGLLLFESRPDKGYSMTDCMSMLIMRGFDADEVLTHDHHFAQEGFVILL